ncbi:MAG: 30S ribosomal protein S6 [Microscillaceae bacterium]|jgi:small subunit ribosomal protein S6|nr:30S ribosomal protein S6 [Microscillaceae bacterium]
MTLNHYETVFILTPVLSDEQMKDTVEKFKKVLTDHGAELVQVDIWGLRKLAYPIKKKSNGFYTVIEFKADPKVIQTLEVEYHRDERVIRHLVVTLDKHFVAGNAKRRNKIQETQQA